MTHRIEIWLRDECGDGRAAGVFAQAKELGASGITAVRSARLFFLRGSLDEAQLNRLADELLADFSQHPPGTSAGILEQF